MGLCIGAAALVAACSGLEVVDDSLAADAGPTTVFTSDDESATLSVRFNRNLDGDEVFMVEWLFPDHRVYLRKPVRRSPASADTIETRIPIRGKAPSRHPGTWQVHLSRNGERLVGRSFEIEQPAHSVTPAAAAFAGLAHCGPSRWNDPVISGRRSQAAAGKTPGAWIGGEVLKSAGATYSSVVLLTGCAPG